MDLAEGPSGGRARRRIRVALTLGVVSASLAIVAATMLCERPYLPTALAALLLLVLPAVSVAQTVSDVDVANHRVELYTSTAVTLFILGALGLIGSWGLEDVPRSLFFPAPSFITIAVGGAALCLACLGITYVFHVLSPRMGWQERPIVHDLMPESRREKRIFGVLSVAAGVGEEIAFRGFLPAYLLPWFGDYLTAALLPALAFGLLHAYQGPHGIARTTLMGVVMAVGVAWTGSLWPAIVAHTVLDLMLGLVLRDFFLNQASDE